MIWRDGVARQRHAQLLLRPARKQQAAQPAQVREVLRRQPDGTPSVPYPLALSLSTFEFSICSTQAFIRNPFNYVVLPFAWPEKVNMRESIFSTPDIRPL